MADKETIEKTPEDVREALLKYFTANSNGNTTIRFNMSFGELVEDVAQIIQSYIEAARKERDEKWENCTGIRIEDYENQRW